MRSQKQSEHVLSTALRATFSTSQLGTHPAAPTVALTPTEKSILSLLRLKKKRKKKMGGGRAEIASKSEDMERLGFWL